MNKKLVDRSILVTVVSTNFRLAFKVQSAISDHFKYNQKNYTDDLSKSSIIVTTKSESKFIKHPNILIISDNISKIRIKAMIIEKVNVCFNKKECILGIDPGKTIGAAIIYMNELLISNSFISIEKLIYWINQQLEILHCDAFIIKIGNGEKYWFGLIYNRIYKEFSLKYPIIPVNEYKTSLKRTKSRTIHEEAAIIIANRD